MVELREGRQLATPGGPKSGIKDRGNHPVVHIAYQDVLAYAKWAGKRLPTEAEFEFAQRGGLERKPYAWGDELKPGGKFMANTFQGHFPDKNTNEDGYAGAAPVASFPPNGYGLYDMAGNVWEWTSDWYRHDYYQTLAAWARHAESARAGGQFRSQRARREKESSQRWLVPLYRPILRALHRGWTREGRARYRYESCGVPAGARCSLNVGNYSGR